MYISQKVLNTKTFLLSSYMFYKLDYYIVCDFYHIVSSISIYLLTYLSLT